MLTPERLRETLAYDPETGVFEHLGYFATPERATAAYIAAAKEHFREFSRAQ